MTRHIRLFIFTGCFVLYFSCTQKPVVKHKITATFSFETRFSLSIQEKGRVTTVSATLHSIPNQNYRLTIHGPLGNVPAVFHWSKEKWVLLISKDKRAWTGTGDQVDLYFLGLPEFPIHAVFGLFLNPPSEFTSINSWELNSYSGEHKTDSGRKISKKFDLVGPNQIIMSIHLLKTKDNPDWNKNPFLYTLPKEYKVLKITAH